MKYKFFSKLLLLGCLLLPIASHAVVAGRLEKSLLAQGYQKVPIVFLKNTHQFIVMVSFNQRPAERFLIDNGTIQTFIFPRLENTYKFHQTARTLTVHGGGGKVVLYRQVRIPSMRLNQFMSKNEVAYYPQQSLAHLKKLDYVGVLGTDFLREHLAYVDIGHRALYLKSADSVSATDTNKITRVLDRLGYRAINLQDTPTGHQAVMVAINQHKPLRFMLDTGSSGTYLSLNYGRQYGFQLKPAGNLIGAEGGLIPIYRTHDVKLVTVGRISLPPRQMSLIDYRFIRAGKVPMYGTLGRDWMYVTNAVLDMPNNTLYALRG